MIYNLPPVLFSVALFISAGLLFWIQPLIAKTLLPLLGGAPAVWNTCLLFFQTMAQCAITGGSTHISFTVGRYLSFPVSGSCADPDLCTTGKPHPMAA
jgi:hypothetical protein